MGEVPINFEWKGRKYVGLLSMPSGGGGSWHLNIKGFHYGQLIKSPDGWQFYNNQNQFKELAQFFGESINNWQYIRHSTSIQFWITVKDNSKYYKYLVSYIPIDRLKEHFRVYTRNKTLLIESNRPLFRNKGIIGLVILS